MTYPKRASPHALYYYSAGSTTPTKYYYVLNLQGDVVQLRNSSNGVVANYNYDAWGKPLSVTNASGSVITNTNHFAYLNPIRYRGYFYDTETKLYYCNSRYYDPQIRRFINADCKFDENSGFIGYNVFSYCTNNPTNKVDVLGTDAIWLQYPERASGFGHTSLLIQGDDGSWHYFFWGAKSTKNKLALVFGTESAYFLDNVGTGRISDMNDVKEFCDRSNYSEATNGLESYIYMKGDFSDSVNYLSTIKNNRYKLLTFNCVQTCTIALSKGVFEKYNNDYKRAMTYMTGFYHPNKAFKAWKYFVDNIDAYNSANWFARLFSKNNPWKYVRPW